MEKNLLVVVLFIVLSTQEIAAIITRTCKSRSREFGGRCTGVTRGNCNIVCMEEEFQYGVCRLGRCYCVKPCGSRPSTGKTPPKKPPQKPPQKPPAHSGTPPPDHQGEQTPPDHQGEQTPPDHQGGGETPPDHQGGGETPPDHQGGGETPPDSEGPPEEFAQFLLKEPQPSKV